MLCATITVASVVVVFGTRKLYHISALKFFVKEVVEENGQYSAIKRGEVRGFLLPVNVDQQLTGGLKGFTQLATLASMFNLSTVEPYVQGTRLVGVPRMGEEYDPGLLLRLSELYDWKDLRRSFKTCSTRNNHKLSSFETFLNNASREVILVHMIKSPDILKSFFPNNDAKIVEASPGWITSKFLSGVSLLNKWAEKVLDDKHKEFAPFKTAHIILVDARPTKRLPLSVIANKFGIIFNRQVSSVTVLIDTWRAITNNNPMASFYLIPGFPWRPCHKIDYLKHSSTVINSTSKFSQGLNDSALNEIVGVHIRGERLLTEYKGNLSICLKNLESLLHNLTLQSTGRGVRIIHDLGQYGTMSCYDGSHCYKKRKSFVAQIQNLGYPTVSFNPAEYSSVPNTPAFAARVEIEYLSNVDILVTLGMGGFQYTIQERFEHKYGKGSKNLHKLCH